MKCRTDKAYQFAFVRGAEWQASQPVTDAEVEAAARVIYELQTGTRGFETSAYRDNWVAMARYALETARAAR
jgi:hypothetical protein